MTGQIGIRSRTLIGSGTITLNPSTGTYSLSLPAITAASHVQIKFVSPSGTPGHVLPIVTAGTGIVFTSNSATDGSTYSYIVDDGNESNSYLVNASVPAGITNAPTLTQLYADLGTAEAYCTSVKAYALSTANQTLWGYFSGPAIVAVDIQGGTDANYWENQLYAPGYAETSTSGHGSSIVSTLNFDSTKGIATTSPITIGTIALRTGSGTPNGSVVGNVGDLYLNSAGGASTTLYVKESGAGTNSGWIGK